MKFALAAIAVLSLAGCGAGGKPLPSLDAFAGLWTVSVDVDEFIIVGDPCHDLDGDGIEETCDPPNRLASYHATVSVTSGQDTMTVFGICDVPIILGGSLATPYWTGQPVLCQRFMRPGCPESSLWMNHIWLESKDGIAMGGSAAGSVDGCGASIQASVALRGRRPE